MFIWIALCACSVGPSQLVELVDSDIPNLEEMTLRVVDTADADRLANKRITLAGPGAVSLPFSIGVAPPMDDPRREVVITGEAQAPGGSVRRIARVGLVPGATLLVRFYFLASCAGVACQESTTCEQSECVDARIEASELDRIDPGSELPDAQRQDTAMRDAGTFDGGLPDARTDQRRAHPEEGLRARVLDGVTDLVRRHAGSRDASTVKDVRRKPERLLGGLRGVRCRGIPRGDTEPHG